MKKTIWISYAFGVKADYPGLYRWFDNIGAVECGDNLAVLKLDIPSTDDPPDFVKTQIDEHVSVSKSDRIYVIWTGDDGQNRGRFISGKRRGSPWQGHGDATPDQDDA
ncbi:hypothetical protein KPL74_01405 [Bacillus sp. NP157]|nr:hypothetical protein KPL74_01405 [Bacillus sp. NP157]